MRNIPVIIGLAMAMGVAAAELPVCQEFEGEKNISCVRSDSVAVISSMSANGRSIEFFKGHKKAYLELSKDGRVVASTGSRLLDVARIPAEDTEKYLEEVMESLMEALNW